jgi:hypothetical protein
VNRSKLSVAVAVGFALVVAVVAVPQQEAQALDPGGGSVAIPTAAAGSASVAAGVSEIAPVGATLSTSCGPLALVCAGTFLVFGGLSYGAMSFLDASLQPPGPSVESAVGVNSTGLVNCPSWVVVPAAGDSKCIRMSAAALPYLTPVAGGGTHPVRFGFFASKGLPTPTGTGVTGYYVNSNSYSNTWITVEGDGGYYGDTSQPGWDWLVGGNLKTRGNLWTYMPIDCRGTPTCRILPDSMVSIWGRFNSQSSGPWGQTPYAFDGADDAIATSGLKRRIRTERICENPENPAERWTTNAYSEEFWDVDRPTSDDYPAIMPSCGGGGGMLDVSIKAWVQTIGGTNYYPEIPDRKVIDYQAAPNTGLTTGQIERKRECLVSLDCPLTPEGDLDTEPCLWGGVEFPESYCIAPQVIVIEDPTPTTTIAPTTTAAPTTTTPSTTTTTTPPPDGPCPGPGCDDGPPEDPEGSACWPEGWGWFNPFEWVYKPVRCVMEWLFIPDPDELDARLDNLGASLDGPPFVWGAELIDMLGASSVGFEEWRYSSAIPCMSALGSATWCATTLDPGPILPAWLRAAVFFGLWALLAYAVIKWL